MIAPQELDEIYRLAYIPEHLPHYVHSITQAEPFLLNNQIVYVRNSHLSWVAYPLAGFSAVEKVNLKLIHNMWRILQEQFQPQFASILSPIELKEFEGWRFSAIDRYYSLDLGSFQPGKKIRNQIKRAASELRFTTHQKFDCRYKKLVNDFLKVNQLSPDSRSIFKRLPRITKNPGCELCSVFNHKGKLVAFDVFDFSAQNFGFYLFNFRSRREYIPGASDYLLWKAIEIARQQGKHFLNMGLGINPGIEKYKEKWGSQPFLEYYAYTWEPELEDSVDSLYAKL